MIPQTPSDSAVIAELQQQAFDLQRTVDSLSFQIIDLSQRMDTTEIGTDFFGDVLSTQTAIFVAIVGIVSAAVIAINWGVFVYPIRKEMKLIVSRLDQYESKFGVRKLNQMNTNIMRSLYEFTDSLNYVWKIIWHIRYCRAILDSGDMDAIAIHFRSLGPEFNRLKESPIHLKSFKNFENKGGLKESLRSFIAEAESGRTGKYYPLIAKLSKEILTELEESE